jgi:hypothetical protein
VLGRRREISVGFELPRDNRHSIADLTSISGTAVTQHPTPVHSMGAPPLTSFATHVPLIPLRPFRPSGHPRGNATGSPIPIPRVRSSSIGPSWTAGTPRTHRERSEKEKPFRRPTRRTQHRPIGWGVGRHVCNPEGPWMSRNFVVNQGRPSDSGVLHALIGDEYHRPTWRKLRSFRPHRAPPPHSGGATPRPATKVGASSSYRASVRSVKPFRQGLE